jgi:hypothetical protein
LLPIYSKIGDRLDRLTQLRGNVINKEILSSTALKGYVWKVIVDPTWDREAPGLFYGRLFRMMDIQNERDE